VGLVIDAARQAGGADLVDFLPCGRPDGFVVDGAGTAIDFGGEFEIIDQQQLFKGVGKMLLVGLRVKLNSLAKLAHVARAGDVISLASAVEVRKTKPNSDA